MKILMARSEKAKAAAAGGVEMTDTDVNGQKRIPTMEVPTIKQIQEFVKRHEATKAEHKILTERLKNENAEATSVLFPKYKDHFVKDEDDNHVYEDQSGAYLKIGSGDIKVVTKLKDSLTENGTGTTETTKPAAKGKGAKKK